MNTTTILSLVGFILLVGGLYFFANTQGQANAPEETSTGALVATPLFYDFGEIPLYGGMVTTEVVLKNEGAEDIQIYAGTTSCGCTEAEVDGVRFGMHTGMARTVTVRGGGETPLTIYYDPFAHGPSGVGLAERSVFIKTNSKERPELEVRIKALVVNK
jgi:hypothetical protein